RLLVGALRLSRPRSSGQLPPAHRRPPALARIRVLAPSLQGAGVLTGGAGGGRGPRRGPPLSGPAPTDAQTAYARPRRGALRGRGRTRVARPPHAGGARGEWGRTRVLGRPRRLSADAADRDGALRGGRAPPHPPCSPPS